MVPRIKRNLCAQTAAQTSAQHTQIACDFHSEAGDKLKPLYHSDPSATLLIRDQPMIRTSVASSRCPICTMATFEDH